jgi:hypothetical protein
MLPDLEQKSRDKIARENIRAAQALHMAYMLDELRMYQVVDRVVDMFKQGVLPIARGPVVQALASYAFDSTRLSEAHRRNVYARAFGVPGGDAGARGPNREFDALWLRFLASVADYASTARPETLLWPRSAANVRVRRSSHAIAVNLTQHCGGETRTEALALHEATDSQMRVLRDRQLLQAYGARDLWQVVEGVNQSQLGGAVSTARVRSLARAGATILAWLATWADGQGSSLSDAAGPDEPSNDDLVAAVSEWLEVTGVSAHDVMLEARGESRFTPAAQSASDNGAQATLSQRFDPSVQRAIQDVIVAARAEGRGVGVLFHGPAGIGKTVAAHLTATALVRELFTVHLTEVVSKFIGETEKNLDRVFDEAEGAGAVLLLDEADALFGKRARAAQVHDANAQGAYLLQRIEDFRGLAILEARELAGIDESLLRSFRAVIPFVSRSNT